MEGKRVRIAVDAMGGDNAPQVNIDGALSALDAEPGLEIILTGNGPLLEAELKKRGRREIDRLQVIHADEAISM